MKNRTHYCEFELIQTANRTPSDQFFDAGIDGDYPLCIEINGTKFCDLMDYRGDGDDSLWADGGGMGFYITRKSGYYFVYIDAQRFGRLTDATISAYRQKNFKTILPEYLPKATSDTAGIVRTAIAGDLEDYTMCTADEEGFLYSQKSVKVFGQLTVENLIALVRIGEGTHGLYTGSISEDISIRLAVPVHAWYTGMDYSGGYYRPKFILESADGTKWDIRVRNGSIDSADEIEGAKAIDPKRIKDMYYDNGVTATEVVPETTVDSFAVMQEPIYASVNAISMNPTVGAMYTVIWDGNEYNLECFEADDLIYIGNENYVFNMVSGGDIPFAIVFVGDIYIATEYNDSHTISVIGIKHDIKQIDPKYIKDMYYEEGVITSLSNGDSYNWEKDKPYTLRVDGVVYEFDSMYMGDYHNASGDYIWSLGATPRVSGASINVKIWDYPFSVYAFGYGEPKPTTTLKFEDGTFNHTVEVLEGFEIHQIDPKYLPDSVKPFVVNITFSEDENGEWVPTADKTFEEIKAAVDAGTKVSAVAEGLECPLSFCDEQVIEFTYSALMPGNYEVLYRCVVLYVELVDGEERWGSFVDEFPLESNVRTTIREEFVDGSLTYSLDGDYELLRFTVDSGITPNINLRSSSNVMRCIEASIATDDCITVCFYSALGGTAIKLMIHADGSVTEWMPM